MNVAGKFDRNMEKVYSLLVKLSFNGAIEIGNTEIAAQCGFKKARQVKAYLQKLKKQNRVSVRLVRFALPNTRWVNRRFISTKPEI